MARSSQLAPNVGRFSRSQVAAKRGNFKGKKTSTPKKVEETPSVIEKTIGGKANGEKRLVPTNKAAKYYPAEDISAPKKSRKTMSRTVLRKSITPGTVLILLAGRFRGKRVVFLKQLDSGLLLVTGPFKLNGVPLRRVAQAYVIATSTKVDITGVSIPETVNDVYFTRSKTSSSKDKEGEFFAEGGEKKVVSEEKKGEQKSIDASLLSAIKKVDNLGRYLKSTWGLSKGDRIHELKF